jgi:cell division septation protein DedD
MMRELDELKKEDQSNDPPEEPKKKSPYLLIFTLGVLVFLALFGYFRVWKGKEAEPPLDEIIPIETMPVLDGFVPPDGTAPIDPSGLQPQVPFSLEPTPPSALPTQPAATPLAASPPLPLTAMESLKEKEPPPLSPKKRSPPKTARPKKERPQPAKKSGPNPLKAMAGGQTIQVGAFSEENGAATLKKRLKAKGYEAYIVKNAVPGQGLLWRVRVGHFPDRASAESIAKKLKEKEGLKLFIISEEKS